jgi:hypothetical protein
LYFEPTESSYDLLLALVLIRRSVCFLPESLPPSIMLENVAIPAITTLGYTGILVGPAAIGFISHSTNLQTAFVVLTILLLGVAASGRLLRV